MQTNAELPPMNFVEGAIFVDAENVVFVIDPYDAIQVDFSYSSQINQLNSRL